jgi:predicted  nucleic acid-binding Zn-ribbon protein
VAQIEATEAPQEALSVIEQLVALAKIADIDAEALRADTELREIPQRMGSLQGDVKKLSELLAAEKQQLLDADKLLQAQEEEINNSSQALAKSKAKGARIRNTREAERNTLRDAIGKRRGSVEKHEREFSELEKFASEEQAKADARLAELHLVRDRILTGRGELVAKVPADVLRRYEMIRSKRQGVGMAAVKNSTCSGCFVVLAPQQVIGIQRGEEFAQCPRCQRILFSPELIAKHTDGAPSTAAS